ncbi:MAG: NIPSNAP family protein [Gammaproteobacteria bacterium]|nr:NIPSNAP family protein [Gammaproteobacteria bacterium]
MIHELRIYRAHPGKMPELLARFRDHTTGLFEKHGMTNIGYWLNTVGGRNDELWYIIGFDSMAHRESAWTAFQNDEDWKRIRAASETEGPLVLHIENRFMTPTDFSPTR